MCKRYQNGRDSSAGPDPVQEGCISTEMQVRFECLGIDRVWPSFAVTLDFESQLDLSFNMGHMVLCCRFPFRAGRSDSSLLA